MEPDFSGYATKAGLKCTDGRTIMPGAFKHQDQERVPLVWQHGHSDPENVLGHAILENRDDGVYTYGYFNDTPKAVHAKSLLRHGDIRMLSIWANQLVERSSKVFHGAIREVSLVLSGANPGALIENVTIRHSDGSGDEELEDEVIIHTGLEIEHGFDEEEKKEEKEEEKEQEPVAHAAGDPAATDNTDGEETIQDIVDSMNPKQRDVLHFLVGQAIEAAQAELAQSDIDAPEANEDGNVEHSDEEGSSMSRNVFEKGEKDTDPSSKSVLSHDDMDSIIKDAKRRGSFKDAVNEYVVEHGITDIDTLFPDAVAIDNVPEFLKRRTEWVADLLGGVRKSPFSNVKTMWADITVEEARAKGYVTGSLKKEEFFAVAKRNTTPTTIYKKQKLDRDDIVDITDFDVVAWLKQEMRLMLDEELARAILVGDGRDIASEDKINEQNIRPIASDHELYTTTVQANIADASSSVSEIIDAIVRNRKYLKGTGLPTMYTSETYIASFLLLKDTLGRRIYKSLDEIASELRVASIVAVEVLEEYSDIVAILVNPTDYVLGATAGGQVTMFDDFDIDYNQYKYLIETRCSGALVKLKSAIVVKEGTFVAPSGTGHVISPEPPHERQSDPPVHGSLPDAAGATQSSPPSE